MSLALYRKKRNFGRTSEPRGRVAPSRRSLRFVIQKHAASRLHYDFRLELEGVLKSWAVPKGPSLDPAQKRLAVEVEDHPLEYGGFEGTIPKGQYGAGSVLVWDRGTWKPIGDAREGLRRGNLKFELKGKKLTGRWVLIRIRGREGEDGKRNWLLIKERDAEARAGKAAEIVEQRPESVQSGRLIEDVGGKEWLSNRPGRTARSTSRLKKGRALAPTTRVRAGNRSEKRSRGVALDPGTLEGSRPAPMPSWKAPQLATLVKEAPEGEGWLHEIKFDGYRLVARIDRGRARLMTRAGNDWSDRFPSVASALQDLPIERGILDGEVVVIQPDGTTSFQALQNALRRSRGQELVYFVFDLVYLDGHDLTRVSLERRKEMLQNVLSRRSSTDRTVRYSDHVLAHGHAFYREACERKLEGIVSKRREAPYVSGRTGSWLKTKCSARQEFVIGGFTDPQGARDAFGALLVGARENGGGLRYCGKVGTGFTHDTLRDLKRKLDRLKSDEPPFQNPPRMRGAHWVRPKLVAEIAYTEMTEDGRLRHPSFHGLREDKPAEEVVLEGKKSRTVPGPKRGPTRRRTPKKPPRRPPPVREPDRKPPLQEPPAERRAPVREPPEIEEKSGARGHAFVGGIQITHPDRVLYPEQGLTKLDLARYYESISDFMLPHVEGRPLMLLRCPEGRGKACFFQKHPGRGSLTGLREVPIREARGTVETYLTLSNLTGLIALVQMGVLEIHVWGARADRTEQPDRVVFDLDPEPSVPWKDVIDCALLLRERLEEIGLESFAKTSGGKGIHIVAPIRRGPGWEEVKTVSGSIASRMVRENPEGLTLQFAKARRRNRIFIDTLRNRRGATWVAPYSPRARAGAPVSVPVAWSELVPKLKPDSFTIRDVLARLSRAKKDPWAGLASVRQTITEATIRTLRAQAARSRTL